MKRIFRHFIIGLILSVVLVVVLLILMNKYLDVNIANTVKETGEKIPVGIYFKSILVGLLGLVFGSVGYTLVKIWHDWFYSHFTVFTRNPMQLIITTYIIDPLIGVVGFAGLGYYLLYKIGFFSKLFGMYMTTQG